MMSVFALSSQADDFACKEIYDVREEVLRARISVNITELKDITPANTNRNYDNAYEVKVTVKSTLQGKTTILKQITAKAITEDVTYNINAKVQNVPLKYRISGTYASHHYHFYNIELLP
jgi:hypothetical protein